MWQKPDNLDTQGLILWLNAYMFEPTMDIKDESFRQLVQLYHIIFCAGFGADVHPAHRTRCKMLLQQFFEVRDISIIQIPHEN